ncbi:hypothetical protein VSS37_06635 [Candidatus Thiothrix sp. Deng01]|uniref:DUF2892 domain-containing protein n=1 Tax=Candidatus Thiothrix phosphatis TaxID=3112415 RepID=A0ABU6CW64_9GAMM|nr:hypothetical protein [Candidatus Thiothrix sp. Deng01]MEB4590648.1 hypothetical protein [Candidatus Thiothrix sp. Deng01]
MLMAAVAMAFAQEIVGSLFIFKFAFTVDFVGFLPVCPFRNRPAAVGGEER